MTDTIESLRAQLEATNSELAAVNETLNTITTERDELEAAVRTLEEVNIELKIVAAQSVQAMTETAERAISASGESADEQPRP